MTESESFLVTGGSGLLGGRVLSLLEQRGSRVASVGRAETDSASHRSHFVRHDFHTDNVINTSDFRATRVMHLAQSREYASFPEGAQSVVDVNITGTAQVLNYALESGSQSFLLASTGGVYAPQTKSLQEHCPILQGPPVSFYAASKISAELLAASFSNHFNITVLRYFFLYGPGQDSTKLIPRLIDKVLRGEPIPVEGPDGAQISPTFVDDAARLTVRAASLGHAGTFNVAGPGAYTIGEITRLIGGILGKPVSFLHQPEVQPTDYVAQTSESDFVFGPPVVGLEQGIATVIEHHIASTDTRNLPPQYKNRPSGA